MKLVSLLLLMTACSTPHDNQCLKEANYLRGQIITANERIFKEYKVKPAVLWDIEDQADKVVLCLGGVR